MPFISQSEFEETWGTFLRNIIDDFPMFKFTFPDIRKIRRLEAENNRRQKEVADAKKSVNQLIELSPETLASLDLDALEKLSKLLSEAHRERQ